MKTFYLRTDTAISMGILNTIPTKYNMCEPIHNKLKEIQRRNSCKESGVIVAALTCCCFYFVIFHSKANTLI